MTQRANPQNCKETINDEPIENGEAIIHHKEGVDLIPANIELSNMDLQLVSTMNRERIMSMYLQNVKKDYDYILIDCMPSLGMITLNAFVAADSVIIPVQAHYLPLKGMTQLTKTIGKVRHQINPNLKIEGIVLTLVAENTNLAKTTEETLREAYGNVIRVFDTHIPVAIKAAEMSISGKSIFCNRSVKNTTLLSISVLLQTSSIGWNDNATKKKTLSIRS